MHMTVEATTKLLEKIAADLSRGDPVFPTCFNITLKVRDLLRDPDISIDKLARALQAEPIISSKLLKLANSAALGPANGNPVSDLNAAIMRLGLDTVKSVAFAVAMEQLTHSRHMSGHMKLSFQIWDHCIQVAVIARLLSRHFKRAKPDEAFFAGLVHDIGAFYLLFSASQEPEIANHPDELIDLMVTWHDGIGHALLDALGQQSEELLMAVQDHESKAPMRQAAGLSDILRAANILANKTSSWHEQTDSTHLLDGLLDAAALDELLAASQTDVAELRSTLTI
jgi:HD-like signal output (HDOD) protein